MTWIIVIWFAIQLVSGCTIGSDQFKGFGSGVPIPKGRWARLVHRDEEPAFYWTILAVQILFTIIYFAARAPAESHILAPPAGLFKLEFAA